MVAGLTVDQMLRLGWFDSICSHKTTYMYYLVQSNLFKERNFDLLMHYLRTTGLEHEVIKWVPFQEEIAINTDRKDIVVFGGVSLAAAAKKYDWKPGIFYNELHDMETYMKHYKDHMLNSDGVCISSQDDLPEGLPDVFFARPTRDTKLFSGGLFSKKGWNESMKAYMELKKGLDHDVRIFVSGDKPYIQQEFRCWVVDNKVITASQYKLGRLVTTKNYDHDQKLINFAQSMVDIYAPSRAFVIDVCLYKGEFKVVEINCINSAGFYDANMTKLIDALENMKY